MMKIYYQVNPWRLYKTEHFCKIRQAFAMANNMASSGLRENVYFTKLYLPQVAPLEVKRVTHGPLGDFGTP